MYSISTAYHPILFWIRRNGALVSSRVDLRLDHIGPRIASMRVPFCATLLWDASSIETKKCLDIERIRFHSPGHASQWPGLRFFREYVSYEGKHHGSFRDCFPST